MSAKVKVSGEWLNSAGTYVKVDGVWKLARSAWQKIDEVWKNWFLQGGLLDDPLGGENQLEYPNFATNTGSGANGTVRAIAIQPDGKIVLGGFFTEFNNIRVFFIARINPDGTRDTSFTSNTDSGADNTVQAIAIQPDGKILLGGAFTTFNEATANYLVRLNPDGTRDAAFTVNAGTGLNNAVESIAIQPDGKILLGGVFTTFNGTTVNRIVRLNSDGTLDTAFTTNTGTGTGGAVRAIAIQTDSKIILGGIFTTFNGTTVNRIVRLNSNGTRDTAFTTNTGTGASSDVNSIAIQPDGKIVLGGNFTSFNGTTGIRIVRLNSDGTRDTAFTPNTGTGPSSAVNSIAIQPDGKIVLGGNFTSFNGTTASRIARLNSNGTLDTAFTTNTGTGASGTVNSVAIQSDEKIVLSGAFATFNGTSAVRIVRLDASGNALMTPGADNTVNAIAIQTDSKIILGGFFTTFNGIKVNRIARLNSNGNLDTAFTGNTGEGPNGTVNSIAIQSDGKIVLGGSFTQWDFATVFATENFIARINPDGTRDTLFSSNVATGANSTVRAIAIQPDGKIVLGGSFTSFNGTTANRIARLNSNGTLDTAFTTNTGTGASSDVNSIAIQPDGKIVVGGSFTSFNGITASRIARLNSNGTLDTDFTTNTGTGASSQVNSLAIQSDGKILLGGIFASFNGTTANYLVRLNPDGTRDAAFTTSGGTGLNGTVNSIVMQSNGKILLGGNFRTFNGTTVNRIVRLNSDGTLDTAFTTNTGSGANNGNVSSIAAQPDGKIVLGGTFTTFNNVLRYRLVRIGGDFAG
jgi:uncharacterized delta-60 repeat protein